MTQIMPVAVKVKLTCSRNYPLHEHEIIVLFVLRKLILQMRMRSHPVGLDVLFFGQTLRLLPYFMCVNSKGSGAGRLCDEYHNLMSWCKIYYITKMITKCNQ